MKDKSIALAAAAIAVCGIVAVLSPVSASNGSNAGTTGYFPDQYVNQAKEIVPMPNTDGDLGLSMAFPKEHADDLIDATPEMYS